MRTSSSSCRESEGCVKPPELTPFGKGLQSVVIAAMVGGVCEHDDWRGDLPRFLQWALPGVEVVVWYGRDRSDRLCSHCPPLHLIPAPPGTLPPESDVEKYKRKQKNHFNCDNYFTPERTADFLLTIGTGVVQLGKDLEWNSTLKYESMNWMFEQPWVRPDTKTVHIPVRTMKALQLNILEQDLVIHDYSFMKPLHRQSIELMGDCSSQAKTNDLLYVARYGKGAKGQVEFLKR
eukprot:scaffold287626_cov45-Prasinocladus_malaysianus.AAC.1